MDERQHQRETAEYLADIIAQLQTIARRGGYHRLARILGMALGEAKRQRNDA